MEKSFNERMKWLERYFKRNIDNNPLFEPEYLAAIEINNYALKEKISRDDLFKIVEIYNNTNRKPHYDGTGWLDLRLHIGNLISKNNCKFYVNELKEIVLS